MVPSYNRLVTFCRMATSLSFEFEVSCTIVSRPCLAASRLIAALISLG